MSEEEVAKQELSSRQFPPRSVIEEMAQRDLIERGAISLIKERYEKDLWITVAQSFIQQMGPVLDGGPMEKFIREECV